MKRHNEQHTTRLARSVCSTVTIALLLLAGGVSAAPTSGEPAGTQHAGDPHYTPAGFFDIHVCNWPGRELFFMSLLSTPRYDEVEQVEVFFPNGSLSFLLSFSGLLFGSSAGFILRHHRFSFNFFFAARGGEKADEDNKSEDEERPIFMIHSFLPFCFGKRLTERCFRIYISKYTYCQSNENLESILRISYFVFFCVMIRTIAMVASMVKKS